MKYNMCACQKLTINLIKDTLHKTPKRPTAVRQLVIFCHCGQTPVMNPRTSPMPSMFFYLLSNIWHQRNMSCSLNSYGKRSLMLCTITGDSAGKNFSSFRYISFQFVCILVIYHIIFAAEYTDFFSSAHSASPLHRSI